MEYFEEERKNRGQEEAVNYQQFIYICRCTHTHTHTHKYTHTHTHTHTIAGGGEGLEGVMHQQQAIGPLVSKVR